MAHRQHTRWRMLLCASSSIVSTASVRSAATKWEMSPGGQLTISGAIDQVFDEMGLHLNFEEPFDRIEKVEKKR